MSVLFGPRRLRLATVVVACLALAGCGAPAAEAPAPAPAESRTPAVTQSKPSTTKSPGTTAPPAPPDNRSGKELAKPYAVRGIVVISKKHRVDRSYRPDWITSAYGLKPEAVKALKRLMADAKRDGIRLVVRSGYRSYAAQRSLYRRQYAANPSVARKFVARAGESEHQSGLAVDVTDGRTRGYAFKLTPHAKWLARHCVEYGFIIRYPEGKSKITGYQPEAWHLRWVGPEVAKDFGPNSRLTLEEYLRLT